MTPPSAPRAVGTTVKRRGPVSFLALAVVMAGLATSARRAMDGTGAAAQTPGEAEPRVSCQETGMCAKDGVVEAAIGAPVVTLEEAAACRDSAYLCSGLEWKSGTARAFRWNEATRVIRCAGAPSRGRPGAGTGDPAGGHARRPRVGSTPLSDPGRGQGPGRTGRHHGRVDVGTPRQPAGADEHPLDPGRREGDAGSHVLPACARESFVGRPARDPPDRTHRCPRDGTRARAAPFGPAARRHVSHQHSPHAFGRGITRRWKRSTDSPTAWASGGGGVRLSSFGLVLPD